MPTFTPPDVPEGVDLMEHIWATRHVIQAWNPKPIKFTEIILGKQLKFELLTHPRLARYELRNREANSLWGTPLTFTDNWTRERSYTVTYQEA